MKILKLLKMDNVRGFIEKGICNGSLNSNVYVGFDCYSKNFKEMHSNLFVENMETSITEAFFNKRKGYVSNPWIAVYVDSGKYKDLIVSKGLLNLIVYKPKEIWKQE